MKMQMQDTQPIPVFRVGNPSEGIGISEFPPDPVGSIVAVLNLGL